MRNGFRAPFTFVLLLGIALFSTTCAKKEEAPVPAAAVETTSASAAAVGHVPRLIRLTKAGGGHLESPHEVGAQVMVEPGDPTSADNYYNAIRAKLTGFPVATLQASRITDMLSYFGYAALSPSDAEQLDPAALMKENIIPGVKTGDILCTRFFAPKIINVGVPFTGGVPLGGFGWRKVLRFRALDGSGARAAGLDAFFLLFNFNSDTPVFPAGKTAGQIQGIVQPVYPGPHRDLYFFVYEALNATNAQRIRGYLEATFDLAGIPGDATKYYVPIACAQCHGSEVADEKGAKVNYLDTDHWIDRTAAGDDFPMVDPKSVIVDGAPAYAAFRQLNDGILAQNKAVGGSTGFAALAASKWLTLHAVGSPYETSHVPPLRRGFGNNPWSASNANDAELLPLLNRFCYRCHSSVRFHVFQREVVVEEASTMSAYVEIGIMPQDRKLDDATKTKLQELLGKVQ